MHGTTIDFGDIFLTVPMYVASELENIFNAYDTTIAGKANTSALASYQPLIAAGTTSQYYRGDKTWQTFPSIPGNPTTNNNVSRSLNASYTIASNVRGAIVSYSINASWNIAALLSGSGAAFLEYNDGTSWITVNNVGKSLNLLTFAGSDDMNLSGFVPSNATNVRIRTTSTNMTISYTRGQEVLL